MTHDLPWWRGAVFYQIYPRSYLDTNHDGVGDLKGITAKLDYVASLGVEGIWISPCFKSPMKDFGYDVSDYRDIDPMFGSLADFDALLAKAHSLGLKIIVDLVLSHTSEQHPWFIESRKNKTNSKADWYVWSDGKEGGLPNNWVSCFGGPAWTFDEGRGQYYLHNFLKEQPDLNFHNPEVQDEILDTAKFWLDRGIDGFRLDVVNFYFHDQSLRDNPPRTHGTTFATQFEKPDPYSEQQHIHDKSQPENLVFLERLRKLMDEYPGTMTLGEIGDDHPYERAAEYTAGYTRLNTAYNTHMMGGKHKKVTPGFIREPISEFLRQPTVSWPSWAFSNHDVVRVASRWQPGGDGFTADPAQAKMLIALLCSLRGTAFLYQGEELGLPEAQIPYEKIQDPWGKHTWPDWQGRDGCRTPMPWNSERHAGFSTAEPWLPVPDTHLNLTVEKQEQDKHSVLSFVREFLRWRKDQSALRHGDIRFHDAGHPDVLAFLRETESQSVFCAFNLGDTDAEITDLHGASISLPPFGFSIKDID